MGIINRIDHDIYVKISQELGPENYVVAYVPFDNMNSTKMACMVVNSVGEYTDNILVVHSDIFEEFNYAVNPVILKVHGDIDAFHVALGMKETITR